MKKIEELTLEEKLGQLLCIGFKEKKLTEDLREMIRKYKFGNFILYSRNYDNIQELEKLVRDIH